MTTFDYTSIASDALALLTEFGTAATIARTTAGEYDAETGTQATTTANHACVALESQSERSYITGQLIEAGHMAYLVAATGLAITPKVGDALNWAGRARTIAKVNTLAPSGTAVLHELIAVI